MMTSTTSDNSTRCTQQNLDDDTRRTIGLIRYYKERLALETVRLQKAVDSACGLRDEGRTLREHNAILEGKCGEMKKYLNFVGDKRRRFREAYYGIVDQEDFEIRDSNRMLRDLIVVNREITEILMLTHRAERDAVEQVAREEEEFRKSIRELLVERNMLKTEIVKSQSVAESDEEKRKMVYDQVKFLERKIDAQQAEIALLDDRRGNIEIQLIAVREEIKRRCPQYALPSLPGCTQSEAGSSPKKDKPNAAGLEIKKTEDENNNVSSPLEALSTNLSKCGDIKKAISQDSSATDLFETSGVENHSCSHIIVRKSEKAEQEREDVMVDQQRLDDVKRSAESCSDEEDLLSCQDTDSFFTTIGSVSSNCSSYQEALDITQEDDDDVVERKKLSKSASDEEAEEPIVLSHIMMDAIRGLDPPLLPSPAPLKATVVNLNLDLPNELDSERDVEAPLLYFPHFEVNPTQSDEDLTQEGSLEGAANIDVDIKTKLTLLENGKK